jgi:hypothetical protein
VKSIKEGTYVTPLIDLAKEILLNEYQMDLAGFLEDERFRECNNEHFVK